MRLLWCWRCKTELPMLDDDEWAIIMEAQQHSEDPIRAMAVINRERRRRNMTPLPPLPQKRARGFLQWKMQYLTAGYQTFTGVAETNPNAVWHHVVSLYGPPCHSCGKPLRTNLARFCAACGTSISPLTRERQSS